MEENIVENQQESVSAESTEVSTPVESAASETPVADAVQAKAKEVLEGKGEEVPPAEVAPAFKPNFKVKVLDKEHEIPKEFQSLIKDANTEKQVREIFEKAYGLDSVKPRFKELRDKYTQTNEELTNIKSGLDSLREVYQGAVSSGNYLKLDEFFSKLQVPEEVILNYALEKVKLYEMAPEQRQLVEGRIKAEREANEVSQRFASTQEMFQQQAVQLKMVQLQTALMAPEVKSFSEQFDTRFGKPGAFRDEVQRQGEMAWYREKIDLSPEQAIERVMKHYQSLVSQADAQQTNEIVPELPQGAQGKRVIVKPQTKTIPNITGKGTSPIKAKPRSIEDLKALAKNY